MTDDYKHKHISTKKQKIDEICQYAEIIDDEQITDSELLITALSKVLKHGTCRDVAIVIMLCIQYMHANEELNTMM